MATGTRLGRRSLKYMDYGRMAATFINLKTDTAWRVSLKPSDERSGGEDEDYKDRVLTLPDEDLLAWKRVTVRLRKEDLPRQTAEDREMRGLWREGF